MAKIRIKNAKGQTASVDFDLMNNQDLKNLRSFRAHQFVADIDGQQIVVNPSKLTLPDINALKGKQINIVNDRYEEPFLRGKTIGEKITNIPSQVGPYLGHKTEEFGNVYKDVYQDVKQGDFKQAAKDIYRTNVRQALGAAENIETLIPAATAITKYPRAMAEKLLPEQIREKIPSPFSASKQFDFVINHIKNREDWYNKVQEKYGGRDIYSGIGAFVPDAVLFALTSGGWEAAVPALKSIGKKELVSNIQTFAAKRASEGITKEVIDNEIKNIITDNFKRYVKREAVSGATIGALEEPEQPIVGAVTGAALGAGFAGILGKIGITKNLNKAISDADIIAIKEVASNPKISNIIRNVKEATKMSDEDIFDSILLFKSKNLTEDAFVEGLSNATIASHVLQDKIPNLITVKTAGGKTYYMNSNTGEIVDYEAIVNGRKYVTNVVDGLAKIAGREIELSQDDASNAARANIIDMLQKIAAKKKSVEDIKVDFIGDASGEIIPFSDSAKAAHVESLINDAAKTAQTKFAMGGLESGKLLPSGEYRPYSIQELFSESGKNKIQQDVIQPFNRVTEVSRNLNPSAIKANTDQVENILNIIRKAMNNMRGTSNIQKFNGAFKILTSYFGEKSPLNKMWKPLKENDLMDVNIDNLIRSKIQQIPRNIAQVIIDSADNYIGVAMRDTEAHSIGSIIPRLGSYLSRRNLVQTAGVDETISFIEKYTKKSINDVSDKQLEDMVKIFGSRLSNADLFSPSKRASLHVIDDNQLLLSLNKNATKQDFIHELFHIWEMTLPKQEKQFINNFVRRNLGEAAFDNKGKLTNAASELIADQFDSWVLRGTKSNLPGKMQGMFRNLFSNLDDTFGRIDKNKLPDNEASQYFKTMFGERSLEDTFKNFQIRDYGKDKNTPDKKGIKNWAKEKTEVQPWTPINTHVQRWFSSIQYISNIDHTLYLKLKKILGNFEKTALYVTDFADAYIKGKQDYTIPSVSGQIKGKTSAGSDISNLYIKVDGTEVPASSYVSDIAAATRMKQLVDDGKIKMEEVPDNMKDFERLLNHKENLPDDLKGIVNEKLNFIKGYSDELMNLLIEGDILDPVEAARIMDANPFHVPFYRIFAEDEIQSQIGNKTGGKVVKELKGSTRDVNDVIENMAMNIMWFTKQAEHNSFLNDFILTVKNIKTDKGITLLDKYGIKEKPANNLFDIGAYKSKLSKILKEQGVLNHEQRAEVLVEANKAAFEKLYTPKNLQDNQIFLRELNHETGKIVSKIYEIDDKNLLEALKIPRSAAWVKAIADYKLLGLASLSDFKNMQRAGITYNPAFTFGNIVRDFLLRPFTDPTAPVLGEKGFWMHTLSTPLREPYELITNWFPTFLNLVGNESTTIGYFNKLASKIGPKVEGMNSTEFLNYLRSRGATGSEFYKASNTKKFIQKALINADKEGKWLTRKIKNPKDSVVDFLDGLKQIAAMAESTSRIVNARKTYSKLHGLDLSNEKDLLLASRIIGTKKYQSDVIHKIAVSKTKDLGRATQTMDSMLKDLDKGQTSTVTELMKTKMDRKSGTNELIDDAVINAYKNATADFSEQGTVARNVGKFTNFFTAALAGTRDEYKAFIQNPVGNSIKLAELVGTYLLFKHLYGEDDSKINPISRNLFLHTKIKINGKQLRIPKPYGLIGMAINTAERIFDDMSRNDPQNYQRVIANIKNIFPSETSLLPPVIGTALGLKFNKNLFFNTPIESENLMVKPKDLRYTPSTTETAKLLANKHLNIPGIAPSPVQVQYIIDQTFGGLGRLAAKGIGDTVINLFKSGEIKPDPEMSLITEMSGINKFLYVDPNQTTYGNQLRFFYDNLKKSRQANAALKEVKNYILLTTRQKRELDMYSNMNKIASDLTNQFNILNQFSDPSFTSMNSEQKRKAIQTLNENINKNVTLVNHNFVKHIKGE